MFENIIYSDEDLFDTSGNRISLRRYRKDMIFYSSFDSTLNANYSIANPIPVGTATLENFGVFAQQARLSAPLSYMANNFERLNTEGTIRARIRCHFNNGTCYQTTKTSFISPIVTGDYYYDIYINNTFVQSVHSTFTLGNTISQILAAIQLTFDNNSIPISVINTPTNQLQFYSQVAGDLIEIKVPSTIPTGEHSLIAMFGGINTSIIPNAPLEDVELLSFGSTGNNRISLIHNTDSELELVMTDSSGVIAINQNFGVWSNYHNSFYAFELTWTDSIVYLFIDGKIFGVVPFSSSFTRVGGLNAFTLRSSGNVLDIYDYDELEIYNVAQHYKNYTPAVAPVTPYATTRPYADIDLGSGYAIGEVSGLNVVSHIDCNFVVKIGVNWYYYYSGSWRISDGSFSQSTDASSFEVYFKDLNFIAVSDVIVRVYFDSDGITECWIETLDIEKDSSGEAPAIITGSVSLLNPVDLSTNYNITITTDKGTTTVNCAASAANPSAVTLDEIKNAINAANVPGLDTVTSDDAGHLILKTITKGSEAYVSVSSADIADALPIVWGDETIDNGEDSQTTIISYQPLFDYIRLQLGEPTVPVELTDEQIQSCLQEAVWYYNKFRNSKENVYYYMLAGDPKEGYEVPSIVGGDEYIIDIVMKPRLPFGYNAAAPFGVQSIYMQHWFQKFGSLSEPGFLTDYYLTLSFMKDISIVMGGQPYWEIRNERLYVYPYPDLSMLVGIKYRALLSLNEVLNEFMIKQYVLAKAKILLGNIRSTFGNSVPGGGENIQLNGAELIAQGTSDLEAVKKDILGQQEPLLPLFG